MKALLLWHIYHGNSPIGHDVDLFDGDPKELVNAKPSKKANIPIDYRSILHQIVILP